MARRLLRAGGASVSVSVSVTTLYGYCLFKRVNLCLFEYHVRRYATRVHYKRKTHSLKDHNTC